MSGYELLVLVHVLGAAIWVGGHLVLATRYLPDALRRRDASIVQEFERRFEPLAAPTLVITLLTGLALAWRLQPDVSAWFAAADATSLRILGKLLLVVATLALALDAKLRLGEIDATKLKSYAAHALAVTALAVALAALGVLLARTA
jgi:uncharacterized membrane protein